MLQKINLWNRYTTRSNNKWSKKISDCLPSIKWIRFYRSSRKKSGIKLKLCILMFKYYAIVTRKSGKKRSVCHNYRIRGKGALLILPEFLSSFWDKCENNWKKFPVFHSSTKMYRSIRMIKERLYCTVKGVNISYGFGFSDVSLQTYAWVIDSSSIVSKPFSPIVEPILLAKKNLEIIL